jgi:hypothetical protein
MPEVRNADERVIEIRSRGKLTPTIAKKIIRAERRRIKE